MFRITILILIGVLVTLSCPLIESIGSNVFAQIHQNSRGRVDSCAQALATLYAYTGIDLLNPARWENRLSEIVDTVVAVDTLTPFLHKSISGRQAWRVSMDGVAPDSLGEAERMIPENLEFIIDRNTGQFLWCTFREVGSDSLLNGSQLLSEIEAHLTNRRESYTGLPSEPPRMTLKEALEKYDIFPPAYEHVTVHYVLYSKNGEEPRPAWVVFERSTRELSSGGGLERGLQLNVRTTIDAISGELLSVVVSGARPDSTSDAEGSEREIE